MDSLREEYESVSDLRENIVKEMNELESNEIVKRYFELKRQNENLYEEQKRLYKEIKFREYSDCNHLIVYSEVEYDSMEGRTHKKRGCIKCGLNESAFYGDMDWIFISNEDKVMCNYLKSNRFYGIETDVTCDLELGVAICNKIREVYPNIDDKTLVKYFEIALDDIRNIKVSDERKENRAKRLLLKPNFNRWNARDVYDEY